MEERLKSTERFIEEINTLDNRVSEQTDKSYLRKTDFWILPILLAIYTIQNYDKSIMGHAVLFGFMEDLGLTEIDENGEKDTSKYSYVSMIFYIGFAAGAYPIVILAQKLRPSHALSGLILIWGILVMCVPSCNNFSSIMGCRALLGIFESGVGPTMNVYMTYWWSRKEQSLRSSVWYSASGVGIMISPMINYGLGSINNSWSYMFYFAGAVTILLSIVIFFLLPDSADTWSSLSAEEYSANRMRVEQNLKLSQKTSIQKNQLMEAFTSHTTYVASFLAFCGGITGVALLSFGPLIIEGFGFSIVQNLAMNIPGGFIYVVSMIMAGYINQRVKNRLFLTVILSNCIGLASTLICWIGYDLPKEGLVVAVLMLATQSVQIYAAYHFAAANNSGHTKKGVVNGIVFIMAALGNVAGSFINSTTPGPKFTGEWIGCTCSISLSSIVCAGSWIWLKRVNSRRDKNFGPLGDSHSSEDITDKKNPDFRYIY